MGLSEHISLYFITEEHHWRVTLFPKYQRGEHRKAATLWPLPAKAALKPGLMVTSYEQVLLGYK